MTYTVTFNKQNFLNGIAILGFEQGQNSIIFEKGPIYVYNKYNVYVFIGIKHFILEIQKRNTNNNKTDDVSFDSYERAFNFIHDLLADHQT